MSTFWSIGGDGARKVIDLWADRTAALRSVDDVEFVLVFENRGAEVGATISHPHGQICTRSTTCRVGRSVASRVAGGRTLIPVIVS